MTIEEKLTGIWREENPLNLWAPELATARGHRLGPADKAKVLNYLRTDRMIAAETGVERCLLCKSFYAGSGSLLSDGEWAWPDTLSHYVEVHDVKLEESFLNTILSN